jgi:hypothetical protein
MLIKALVALSIVSVITFLGYQTNQAIIEKQTLTYNQDLESVISPYSIDGETDRGFGPRQYIRVRSKQ